MKKLVLVAASLAALTVCPAFAAPSSRDAARMATGRHLYLPVIATSPSVGLPDLPPRQLLQAPAAPSSVSPPATPSFSDRVTSCLQSFPLNAGIGNNPTDRDTYVRQCVN